MKRLALVSTLGSLGATVLLAACGGGGSGSSGGSPSIPVTNPTTSPVVTTTLSGSVRDLDNGSVVSGATVVASSTLYETSSAPAGVNSAKTDASGNFKLSNVTPGPDYIEVFPTDSHVPYHNALTIVVGNNTTPVVKLTTPTATEAAWFAQINIDRAPYASAYVMDEKLTESARLWATYMATTGFYAHGSAPGAAASLLDPNTRYTSVGGTIGNGKAENIDSINQANTTSVFWQQAETAMMAEQANCPGGNPVGCPNAENTGHFLNIIDSGTKMIGLGVGVNGLAPSGFAATGDSFTFFDQDFM